jgi:hypothetical protein
VASGGGGIAAPALPAQAVVPPPPAPPPAPVPVAAVKPEVPLDKGAMPGAGGALPPLPPAPAPTERVYTQSPAQATQGAGPSARPPSDALAPPSASFTAAPPLAAPPVAPAIAPTAPSTAPVNTAPVLNATVVPPAPAPGSGTVANPGDKQNVPIGREDQHGRPPQGRGVVADTNLTQPTSPPAQPLSPPLTPVARQSGPIPDKSSPVQGATALEASVKTSFGEVLPSTQDLAATMRQADRRAGTTTQTAQTAAAPASTSVCVPVTLRPDPKRSEVTMVDFTGDGLIVSPVPNSHINTVFARAGYQPVQITQPVRWCVAQTAARELLNPPSTASNTLAGFLVQVGQAWRLMSQEQWQSYQASLQPVPVAAAAPTAVETPSSRKPSVRSTSNRSTAARAGSRLVAKPLLPALR